MSVALIKGLVFGRPDPGSERTPLLRSAPNRTRSPSSDTIVEPDLESQAPKGGLSSSQTESPRHKIDPRIISDATIGLSDGLTVPFALTAGLSALGSTKVVIFGGLAELIAGAISMGLGGYLGAKSEEASYHETKSETEHLIHTSPSQIRTQIHSVFHPYNLPPSTLNDLTTHLARSPHLPQFLLSFHHRAHEPPSHRALVSALTIAAAYFLGGFVPLLPYFFVRTVYAGLCVSAAVMAAALFAFGYVKTCVVSGWGGWRCVGAGVCGGVQMVVIGGVAAGAAMGLVMGFNRLSDSGGVSLGEGI